MTTSTTTTTRNANDWCVIYRTGGTANFQWQRSCAMSEQEAIHARAETERMGYPAMIARYSQSVAIGLPETYDIHTPIADA